MSCLSSFSTMVLSRKAQLWTEKDSSHPPVVCEGERLRSTDSDDRWHCCALWQRKLSNKLNAKEFASRCGARVAQLFWDGSSPNDIPFPSLPPSYVVKTVNGSASQEVIPVRDQRDVLRNRAAGPSEISSFYEELLGKPQYRRTSLLVEEFVEPMSGEVLPRDYKVYCFAGKPRYIEVIDRTRRRDAWYTPDWERVPDRMQTCFDPDTSITRPLLLGALLVAAKRLSDAYGYPFVRLDFYLPPGGVTFGEFTHTPFAGKSVNRFTSFGDDMLGRLWQAALLQGASSEHGVEAL